MSITFTKRQKEVLEYLKKYYEDNGISPSMKEVAKHFAVSISTVQGYFNELKIKGAIGNLPNKSRSIFLKTESPKNQTVSILLRGTISAGEGISVYEENEAELIEVPATWVNKSLLNDYYCLKVSGFSMHEDGILDGDYILVKRTSTAVNGETIVAIIKDNFDEKATLKVYFDRGSKIELKPKNEYLDPMFIDRKNLEIRGKFCGLIRSDSAC